MFDNSHLINTVITMSLTVLNIADMNFSSTLLDRNADDYCGWLN